VATCNAIGRLAGRMLPVDSFSFLERAERTESDYVCRRERCNHSHDSDQNPNGLAPGHLQCPRFSASDDLGDRPVALL
jgi:hypothetical protein